MIGDERFQNLVLILEDQLSTKGQEFSEQHLANVVWGAAKLRLLRLPLFQRVEVPFILSFLLDSDRYLTRKRRAAGLQKIASY